MELLKAFFRELSQLRNGTSEVPLSLATELKPYDLVVASSVLSHTNDIPDMAIPQLGTQIVEWINSHGAERAARITFLVERQRKTE